ncbi:unnamed protein product [Prunus armeniaca]
MSMYARSSCLTISAKEIMYGTMMCWKSADSEKAMLVMVYLFPSPTATNDICKRLDLGSNMVKVGRALSIPAKFHEWRWLLS